MEALKALEQQKDRQMIIENQISKLILLVDSKSKNKNDLNLNQVTNNIVETIQPKSLPVKEYQEIHAYVEDQILLGDWSLEDLEYFSSASKKISHEQRIANTD